jgi:thiol-disulfide isomerase/thioredoxin
MKRVIILLACILLSFNVFSQELTCLKGISGDSLVKDISILYFSPFAESNFSVSRHNRLKKNADDQFREELYLDTFRTGQLSGLSSRSQKVFITPGDSVFFITDTVSLTGSNFKRIVFKFSGKNAAHYNYGYLSETELYPFFKKGDDPIAYKDTLSAIKKRKYVFLEAYRQKFSVSEAFYEYAKADILNEYIWYLHLPLISGAGKVKMSEIPSGYFDKTLRPVNELSSYYPVAMLYSYIEYYSENIWGDLDSIYSYIKNDFSGKEREYLISALIGHYAAAQKTDYQSQLQEIIKEAPKYVSDSLYLDYIAKADVFYFTVNNPFPEDVRNNTFLKELGQDKVISLDEILQKHKGKPLYIDFWASWCGPCIGDIEDSQEAKAYLKGKEVEYIYIAFRDEEKAWNKASEQLNITTNQYMLLNSMKSPLYNYLKIISIPRYLVIDADQKIVDGNAPRPTPKFFNDLKKSVEKCFKKEVFFY